MHVFCTFGGVRNTGPNLGLVLEFGFVPYNIFENFLACAGCQNT